MRDTKESIKPFFLSPSGRRPSSFVWFQSVGHERQPEAWGLWRSPPLQPRGQRLQLTAHRVSGGRPCQLEDVHRLHHERFLRDKGKDATTGQRCLAYMDFIQKYIYLALPSWLHSVVFISNEAIQLKSSVFQLFQSAQLEPFWADAIKIFNHTILTAHEQCINQP